MIKEALKILFVINPKSGTKSKINWEPTIREYLRGTDHTFDFLLLTGNNDADSLHYWIEHQKPDRVVAIGGDGTVSLVAEQLLGSPVAMGILPAGSANGMAKELNIPTDVQGAINVILNGEIKKTDVIRINDKEICLHLSDLGINAQIIKYFEERNIRGKLSYARMLLKALWKKQLMRVTIEMNGVKTSTAAFMVVIANASKYGTGAVINPEGNLHDGIFEVIVVRKITLIEFLKLFIHFRRFNPKTVQVFQTTSAIIQTKNEAHFQVDGEYLGKLNRVTAVIEPSSLHLLLPPSHS